jgi:hypothetical protein
MNRSKIHEPVADRVVGRLATVIAIFLTQFCRLFVGTPAR